MTSYVLVWLLLIFAWSANFVVRIGFSALLPSIIGELHLSYTQAGPRGGQVELADDRRQQRREPDADDEVRRPREDEQEPHEHVRSHGRHAVGSLALITKHQHGA